MKKHKISFYTLGCRLNQSETAVIQHTFALDDSFEIVDFDEPADIVVLNTCTVTEKGDADARKLINRINRLNPHTSIALIGCQAEIQKEKLTRYRNVKWVIGNAKKIDLLAIIKDHIAIKEPLVVTPDIPRNCFTMPIAGINEQKTRANLKIQDGCDFFCAYCEIPYARGRSRSRDFKDILKEARYLSEHGHKELILTGINVGTYQQNHNTILDVIKALEQIDGIERIRISSIEYTTIDQTLIYHMKKSQKLCRYLHIPLQSGCNEVLQSMNRKYQYEEFMDFIRFCHSTVEAICLGTDIIVGFPTETDAYFENTLKHLKESPFHYFHVFSYSKRNQAKSRKILQAIPIQTIQKRSALLRKLSQIKRKAFHDAHKGTVQKILFEQKKQRYWTGLTDNYIRVSVESKDDLANCIRDVKIISTQNEKVYGQLSL